jgi:hypothetical protein
MRRSLQILLLAIFVAGSGSQARAHHGRDFLVLQDFYLPEMYNGVLIGSFEAAKTGSQFDYGIEPQFLFGIFPGAAVGVSMGFTDPFGGPWGYEDVMPRFYYQITPKDSDFPIRIAFSAGYQFGRSVDSYEPVVTVERSTSPSGSTTITRVVRTVHQHSSGPSGNPDDPGGGGHVHTQVVQTTVTGEESGGKSSARKTQQTSAGHSHSHAGSTHLHGENAFFGTLVVEAALTPSDKVVFNLINALADDGEAAWGYAAGVRHNFGHFFSMSVEAAGDFSSDGYQELNLGAFFLPHHNVTLRGGLGIGLTPVSPDSIIRAGVVWRF